MKIFYSITLSLFLSLSTFALPQRTHTKKMTSSKVGVGKNITLNVEILLPKGQKLNKQAPSQLVVYEEIASQWRRAKMVNLNEIFFIPGGRFQFQGRVQLASAKSKIAIDSTVYHCAEEKGPCYIDSFQKTLARSTSGNQLALTLIPEIPKIQKN